MRVEQVRDSNRTDSRKGFVGAWAAELTRGPYCKLLQVVHWHGWAVFL